ncbi:MAG TPA: endonuclease/exonuclease/phosphatase family protein [Pyrinomonadaceae bacterium]
MSPSTLPFKIESPEFSEQYSNAAWPSTPEKLVVASYNIRYARGPYLISGGIIRKLHLLRKEGRDKTVSKNIQAAAAALTQGVLLPPVDILGLQEADKATVRSGGIHVARELAAEMNMRWVHAPAGIPRGIKPVDRQWWLDFEEPIDLFDKGDTGVSIISRHPLEEITRIDLPWQECLWRPRLAIAGSIPVGERKIRLINVHVDPHAASGGQLEQLEVIARHAEQFDGPAIILGDFNTLSKKKCIDTRQFMERRGYATPFVTGTATWHGAGLRLHADWIFTRGLKVERFGVVRPLSASDHWPIWAEVMFDTL